ncbi:MAG: hypothetical protein AAFU73_24005, partial [Planctomycetota bacterium]
MRLRLRPVLALAALSPLLPTAAAQSAPIAWDVPLVFAGATVVEPIDALPTPDGGVVVLATSFASVTDPGSGGPATVHAVSLTANGTERWRFEADVLGSSDDVSAFGPRHEFAGVVDDAGALHVVWSDETTSFFATLEPSGSVRTLRALDEGSDLIQGWEVAGIGLTPAGDLRVGGTFRTPFLGYEQNYTRVDSIAPDGNLNWQYASSVEPLLGHDLLIAGDGTTYVLGAFEQFSFSSFFSAGVNVLSPQGFYLGTFGGVQDAYFHAAESPGGGVAFVGAKRGTGAADVLVADGGTVRWTATFGSPPLYPFDVGINASGEVFVARGVPTILRRGDGGVALPSWTLPGGPTVGAYALTVRDDNHVLVHGGDAATVVTTLFDPAGGVVWTTTRPGDGTVPADTAGDGPELDVVVGAFGNVFTTYRATVDGPSGPVLSVGVQKLLDGAPVGQTYCDPAVTNSTGVPGRIQAFGSDA